MPNPSQIPDPAVSSERSTSLYVLVRFSMRALILVLFASVSKQGFANALSGMLGLATFYCLFAATFRREAIIGPVLTHFDEAAGYALVAGLAARLG
jgi:hypothetical protein